MNNTEYSFTPVSFPSAKRHAVAAPVAASVHKTCLTRVNIRISSDVAKRAKLEAGMCLTPFLDEKNRALLLIEGQRPLPESARKLYKTTGISLIVEFPRSDAFAKLFPAPLPASGLRLAECSPGRIVVVIPKFDTEKKP